MTAVLSAADFQRLITRALAPGALQPAFQPVVELETGRVAGYEALARWPGQVDADPGSVFAAAAQVGQVVELDWACRQAGLRAALAANLGADQTLFLNVEAATLGQPAPPEYRELVEAARGRFRVVLELTERELLSDPAELLRLVGWARDQGWGIAMDDVGAEPDSLSLLPFVAPDVVKLDLSLVQQTHGHRQASTMLAVMDYAEQTGAVVLAEGIETSAHLDQALTLGATYGQGWMLGRPGPIRPGGTEATLPRTKTPPPVVRTPFDLVADAPTLRTGRKRLLLGMSRQLERMACAPDEPAVLLSAFQHGRNLTPATATRYQAMAAGLPFVGALGLELSTRPVPGVRGARLDPADQLIGEWTVVVIGPHYHGALIARDCGDSGPDLDRRFDFVLTQNRELVWQAGRSLMSRLTR